jgi:hypothetical protein
MTTNAAYACFSHYSSQAVQLFTSSMSFARIEIVCVGVMQCSSLTAFAAAAFISIDACGLDTTCRLVKVQPYAAQRCALCLAAEYWW